MRIAVLSDIHGNLPALEAVCDDLRQRGADQVVVLGDLAFKGPHPRQCIDRVRSLNPVAVIQGNTDQWLVEGLPPRFTEADDSGRRMIQVHRWTLERLDDASRDFLTGLPFSYTASLGGEGVLFVHATPASNVAWVPLSASDDELQTHFHHPEATFFVTGHVHTPGLRRLPDGRSIVNAGSVGLPWDGDWRASYAILEGDGQRTAVNLIRVPYDIERTVREARRLGMPDADAYGEALSRGTPF